MDELLIHGRGCEGVDHRLIDPDPVGGSRDTDIGTQGVEQAGHGVVNLAGAR
jgi:hypothetical protein